MSGEAPGAVPTEELKQLSLSDGGDAKSTRAPPLDSNAPPLTDEEEMQRVYISTSSIPGTGRGVFARWDFEPGDLVVEFKGKRYDDWTQTYSNCKYAVEIRTNEGNLAYIDGYGVGGAAKIANDAAGPVRVPGVINNTQFTVINERVFLAASVRIPKDTEVFVAYGHDYWYVSEEEYSKVYDVPTTLNWKRPIDCPEDADKEEDQGVKNEEGHYVAGKN